MRDHGPSLYIELLQQGPWRETVRAAVPNTPDVIKRGVTSGVSALPAPSGRLQSRPDVCPPEPRNRGS